MPSLDQLLEDIISEVRMNQVELPKILKIMFNFLVICRLHEKLHTSDKNQKSFYKTRQNEGRVKTRGAS